MTSPEEARAREAADTVAHKLLLVGGYNAEAAQAIARVIRQEVARTLREAADDTALEDDSNPWNHAENIARRLRALADRWEPEETTT